MLNIIGNIILGLSLAAPIGPVNSEAIRRGLAQGFWGAFSIRFGAAIANVLCLTFAYLGMASIINIPSIRLFIWIVGSAMLLIMGYRSMKSGFQEIAIGENLKKPGANTVVLGFILGIANPFAFVWWFGVFGAVMGANDTFEMSFMEYLNCMTMLIGILSWSLFLAFSLSYARNFMTRKGIRIVSILAGASLMYFGLKYGYKGILELYAFFL